MHRSWIVSRGNDLTGSSTRTRGPARKRWLAALAIVALPLAAISVPSAFASTTPPFTIGDEAPGAPVVINIPGSDATGPNASNPDDPEGNVKELGPLNASSTKIGVIHNDVPPTLDKTNPNGQVDLRQAWINSAKDTDGDDWVYFAWERDNETGSGFIAYEFMQKAAPTACGTYDPSSATVLAQCNPWANRDGDTDGAGSDIGDFLILWDQQGGSKDLFYRKWVGTAPNLTLSAPVLLTANVAVAEYSVDGFRGEAAINITDVVFGGNATCLAFANIIPSTVTGNSDSADYKDTILQPGVDLSNCGTTTTTTPRDSTGAAIPSDGISITTNGIVEVKDRAVIALTGAASGTVGGTIDFTLCRANDSAAGPGGTPAATSACDTTNAKSVLVDDDKNLVDEDGVPGFPVTVTSSSAWVTAAGRYCWKAVYSGNEAAGYTGSSDVSTNECFVINPVTPTLSTTAGPAVTLGSPVTDTATLTGTAPKPTTAVIHTTSSVGTRTPAGGTIAFTLWGPADTGCGSQVTLANQSVTVSGDSSASNVYGASYTPTAAGEYHWKAVYSGDSPNTLGKSHNDDCSVGAEDVVVGPASTTTVTTPRVGTSAITAPVAVGTSVTDHAVVSGTAAGGKPTGTVNFFVCNPTEVATNGGTCSSGGTAAGSVSPLTPGTGNTSTADSNAVVVNAVGTWCFRAVYVPDTQNYTGSSDSSLGECFSVKDSTTASSEQDWLPNDTATITSAGGTPLNGSLEFTLYSGDNCGETSGSTLGYTKSYTLTNASSLAERTKSTDNASVKVLATSSVSWLVEFTSTDPLVDGSSHCETTSLVITN